MRTERPISAKKQALIDAMNSSPLAVGDVLGVVEHAINKYKSESTKTITCTIVSVASSIVVCTGYAIGRHAHTILYTITKEDIVCRDIFDVGANSFDTSSNSIRPVAFAFSSILFALDVLDERNPDRIDKYDINGVGIARANWNPFVFTADGSKQFYQRPFVWALEDKQLLVESIYQNIDCGKILVRKRGFDELKVLQAAGETELAFNDIVDGKQRLNAVKAFMLDEFPDLQGNYYSDLSNKAQHLFTNHQLFSYAEMSEDTRDVDVIKQFLKLNFSGVPQSKEHIEFVKSINAKF